MTDTLLLDELAEINAAYANEEVTPEQEKRGQELVHLADAAPDMLATLEKAVWALNAAPRFRVSGIDTDSYAIAAACDRAIAKARGKLHGEDEGATRSERGFAAAGKLADALKASESAMKAALDILHYEDDLPVTALEGVS